MVAEPFLFDGFDGYVGDTEAACANFRALGTGDNEWFTPVQYIEAARRVLGRVDLDPASHPMAQAIVQAGEYFTKADDGLKHPWYGRVWLNPPYARGALGSFVGKLLGEIEIGNTAAAIMLTHNYTDSAWFQQAAKVLRTMCFARRRIYFFNPQGDEMRPTQGQVFWYYGPEAAMTKRFVTEFGDIGLIATIDPALAVPPKQGDLWHWLARREPYEDLRLAGGFKTAAEEEEEET